MKLFRRNDRTNSARIPQISPTSKLDISAFQQSTISVSTEISRHPFANGPFSNRESRLRVRISNDGETEIENLSIEAIAPDGTMLVDPGILFGTTRRHVRLPRLMPKKSVTYKLGIRAREGFVNGELAIEIKENFIHAENLRFQVKIGLTCL